MLTITSSIQDTEISPVSNVACPLVCLATRRLFLTLKIPVEAIGADVDQLTPVYSVPEVELFTSSWKSSKNNICEFAFNNNIAVNNGVKIDFFMLFFVFNCL